MPLTLRQIRYFIATADTGQVSHAAVEVNVSQSAITAGIKQLEEELGVTLFQRHNSGVRLTTEGMRFVQHARNILAVVNTAEHAPLTEDKAMTGTVRVGTSYTVSGYFLSRHLARFRRSYAKINVELHELPRDAIEMALRDGSLDLAVVLVSNISDKRRLGFETLMRSRRRLWLPPEHPLLIKETISLEDIAPLPYVMLTVDEASQTASKYWKAKKLRPNIVFSTSSVEAVRSMVADGLGVTILSDMVYRPWSLEGQRIELRSVAADIPTMDVGTAWYHARELSPPTRTLLDFLSLSFGGAAAAT
jgi:DNA-binding transcriptional LysR family regulator